MNIGELCADFFRAKEKGLGKWQSCPACGNLKDDVIFQVPAMYKGRINSRRKMKICGDCARKNNFPRMMWKPSAGIHARKYSRNKNRHIYMSRNHGARWWRRISGFGG
jgi:hypothetical protein